MNAKSIPSTAIQVGRSGTTRASASARALIRCSRSMSTNDIKNAFDAITYQKGGGVLSMFER